MATTRLQEEVWARDRCAGCAMCVAACSKQVLEWNEREHPHLQKIQKNIGLSKFDLDTCSFCRKFCEITCPRLQSAARLRPLEQISARASGQLPGGDPNDVVRNLLIGARAAGLIDGAIMIDADRSGRTRARIVTSAGEIAESTGFQYIWTPVLGALNEAVFDLGLKSLAVISTPCASQALRLLKDSREERLAPYRQAIRLNVALFCTGVFQPGSYREMLTEGTGVPPESIRRITAFPNQGKMRAELWEGSYLEMDMTEAEVFTRTGCSICDDYLGESADLAVGSVGAPEGYSTLILRTPIADAVVQNAAVMKLIETNGPVDEAALEQAGAAKDKRQRAQAFDELQLLMLDALKDPRKRAEVKVQFDLLYGRARPISNKEDYRYAGCGDCSGC